MALAFARAAGPRARVLVDTGHHYQSQNIEQIVAWLLAEGMLGGFHFNDRRYADDDLTLGSIDPYQVFRIFHEILFFESETGTRADIAYMIDQSHNLKGKIEAMIQTVVHAQELYARAALVDHSLAQRKDLSDVVLRVITVVSLPNAISVGRHRNPSELTRIEPIHLAAFARIDDDVARAVVAVIDHRPPAPGAGQSPVARLSAAGQRGLQRTCLVETHGVDDGHEAAHLDQHAETSGAAEQRLLVNLAVRQRCRAEGAQGRRLTEERQTFQGGRPFRQHLLSAAVVAHQTPMVHSDGRTAVLAFRHDRLIGHRGPPG